MRATKMKKAISISKLLPLAMMALAMLFVWVLLTFHPMQGASTFWYQNLFAAVFVVVFGFLFVTVAGRISGLLGNSSNPISGMSIATLMATCAIFFLAGWTAPNYAVLALMIGLLRLRHDGYDPAPSLAALYSTRSETRSE